MPSCLGSQNIDKFHRIPPLPLPSWLAGEISRRVPQVRRLKCTTPQQTSGLLTACIHTSRFTRIAISYINPAEHPSQRTCEPNSITSVIQNPPKRSTNTHLRKPVHSIASTTMMQTVDPSQPKPIQYASPPSPPASNTGSPKSMSVLNATETDKMTISTHHHILIVTGPAGCGKSTVAKHLSDRYGFDYIEGDEVS